MSSAGSEPVVSVVMGVRDEADRLEETLDSVLAQEGVPFELVVVDDGSRDETPAILRERARHDARVRVLTREPRGLTVSLIEGCEAARGRYVARQDAADVSLPDRLRLQAAALDDDPGLAFVACWTEIRGPGDEYLFVSRGSGEAVVPRDVIAEGADGPVLLDDPPHHGSVMFRKSAYDRVGGYRRAFYLAQDRDLWPRLAEVGTYQTLPHVLYAVRVIPSSRSSVHRDVQLELGRLGREALRARRAEGSDREVVERAERLRPAGDDPDPRARARTLHFVGEMLRQNGDPRAAEYLRRAVREHPWNPRTWVRLAQAEALRIGRGEGGSPP